MLVFITPGKSRGINGTGCAAPKEAATVLLSTASVFLHSLLLNMPRLHMSLVSVLAKTAADLFM